LSCRDVSGTLFEVAACAGAADWEDAGGGVAEVRPLI